MRATLFAALALAAGAASAQVTPAGAPAAAATVPGGPIPAQAAPAPAAAASTPAPAAAAPAAPAAAAAAPAPANPAPSAAPTAPMPGPKAKPPPAESVFALKDHDYRLRVTVRPGEPQPGKLIELQLDVSQFRDPPDPTYGDEAPLESAMLSATFSGPGAKVRDYVRPLGDVGSYGVHWTPPSKGLWTVAVAPLSGQGPTLSFEIGVGVPMPPSAQGQEVQTSRLVLGGRAVKRMAPLTPTMRELNDRWLKLLEPGDASAEAARLGDLLRSVAGRAPQAFSAAEAEFDELAKAAAAAAEGAAKTPAAQREQAMRGVELNSCTRCHVKFRDGVVDDVSHWPEVKPWAK